VQVVNQAHLHLWISSFKIGPKEWQKFGQRPSQMSANVPKQDFSTLDSHAFGKVANISSVGDCRPFVPPSIQVRVFPSQSLQLVARLSPFAYGSSQSRSGISSKLLCVLCYMRVQAVATRGFAYPSGGHNRVCLCKHLPQ
jgi:hypothetical protein